MKFIVSLDFKSKLKQVELRAFAFNVLARMQGNPNFSSIQGFIETDLKSAVERYSDALAAAADGSYLNTAKKNNAIEALLVALEMAAWHLNIIAMGDEALVLEAGFNVRNSGQRRGLEHEEIKGLTLRSNISGQVLVKFSPLPNAKMYEIQWRRNEEDSWHHGIFPTSSRFLLTSLPVRTDILVRVRALGANLRQTPMCQPVAVFVQ